MGLLVAMAPVQAASRMSAAGVSTTGYFNADGNVYSGGSVGIGVPSPAAKLDVSGTLRFSNGGEACDAARKGAIKYMSNDFYVCRDGSAWESLTSLTASSSAATIASTLVDSKYVGNTDTNTATTDTFTSVNLGTASAGRNILVVMTGDWVNGGNAFSVSSMTIGGVAARKLYEVSRAHRGVSFWMLRVPTGTSANIVANYTQLTAIRSIAVYNITGLQQGMMASGEGTMSSATHTLQMTPTPSNSVVFYGFVCGGTAQSSYTWSNATKDVDMFVPNYSFSMSYGRMPVSYVDTYTAGITMTNACTYSTLAGVTLM